MNRKPEINPHTYGQLVFNKGGKRMEKRQSLQQVVLGKQDSCMKINEVRTLLHTTHKNKLQMASRLKYKT